MDTRNLNTCRISGITNLTEDQNTANETEKANHKMDAIYTEVDTNADDFISCVHCGGKIRKDFIEVTGGKLEGAEWDGSGEVKGGTLSDLGYNVHCPHCGEDPKN